MSTRTALGFTIAFLLGAGATGGVGYFTVERERDDMLRRAILHDLVRAREAEVLRVEADLLLARVERVERLLDAGMTVRLRYDADFFCACGGLSPHGPWECATAKVGVGTGRPR